MGSVFDALEAVGERLRAVFERRSLPDDEVHYSTSMTTSSTPTGDIPALHLLVSVSSPHDDSASHISLVVAMHHLLDPAAMDRLAETVWDSLQARRIERSLDLDERLAGES